MRKRPSRQQGRLFLVSAPGVPPTGWCCWAGSRDVYESRLDEIADAISIEMGAPLAMAKSDQAWSGLGHIEATMTALESFVFEEKRGSTLIVHEAIGVAGLITPWNWPMNQIACKVALGCWQQAARWCSSRARSRR